MGSTKGKIKVKVSPKRKAVKPNMGKGTGGVITATLIAKVKKRQSKIIWIS